MSISGIRHNLHKIEGVDIHSIQNLVSSLHMRSKVLSRICHSEF